MTVGRDPATISIGPGTLYWGPIGTAEPTTLTGAWDAAFVDLGYTEKGSTFTNEISTAAVEVAEEFYRVSTTVTGKNGKLDFALSQLTAFNMKVAFNGGTIVTAAGYVTFEPPDPGTEVRAMLGWQSKDGSERYIWRQCFQDGPVATARQKVLPQALIPVSFVVEKPAGVRPWKWFGSLARSGS